MGPGWIRDRTAAGMGPAPVLPLCVILLLCAMLPLCVLMPLCIMLPLCG